MTSQKLFPVNLSSYFVVKEFGDEVIGKKWIYLERDILHRQTEGQPRRRETMKYGVVSFYGLGNFTG